MSTPAAKKWAYWAVPRRHRRGYTGGGRAYTLVAEEFGVPEYTIRTICGPVGQQNITFNERLAVLRAKMDAHGLNPIRIAPPLPSKDDEDFEEPRELRACILCKDFLEDTDPGKDVINSEDYDEHAVLCHRCRDARSRI